MQALTRTGLTAVLLAAAAFAHAADGIHWTVTGPTSVTFDWRGPDSTLRYGLTSAYGHTALARTPDPVPWSSTDRYWETSLSGLLPDTVYHYSISGGPDHRFRTARARGKSGFVAYAYADIGSSIEFPRVTEIHGLVAAGHPALVLPAGDLTYGNDHGAVAVDRFFNDIMVWSQDAACMPTWGNHEYEPGSLYADDFRNYKGRFEFPNPKASPNAPALGGFGEDWYWYDYGNTRFIIYPEPFTGAFANWYPRADSLMDEAQADPEIMFIVTYGHRPAYSSGHHPGSPSLKSYLDALGATHSKYVLNINGHAHNYERTYPQQGVIHITAGGGGAQLQQDVVGECLWRGGCPPPAYSAFRAYRHGPVKLTFDATTIKIEAICGPVATGSNPSDLQCTVGTVFDSITIVRKPPDSRIDAPPNDLVINQGSSVHWAGTPIENNGSGQAALFQWNFDGAAANSTVEDPGPVLFNVPGTYHVTFQVRDQEGYADPTPATRNIVVRPGSVNQAPIAFLDVAPRTGNAPLVTTVDPSDSSDPDGAVTFYTLETGDGGFYAGGFPAAVSHTYVAGNYTARLLVRDNRGAQSASTVPIIVASVQNGPNLASNPSVETSLQGWGANGAASLLRLLGGFDRDWSIRAQGPANSIAPFGVNDSPNGVATTGGAGRTYRFSAWVRSDASHGSARIQIREFLGSVKVGPTVLSTPVTLSPTWQLVTVDFVTGSAGSTLDFQVLDFPIVPLETFLIDNITIKEQTSATGVESTASAEFSVLVGPNPLRHSDGEIRLTLPRAASVRAQILDLGGRLVREVIAPQEFAPGSHTHEFTAVDAAGSPLRAGLYFMRVETSLGTRVQRFAVLR